MRTMTRLGLAGALLFCAGDTAVAQATGSEMVTVAGVWELVLQNDESSFEWNVTFKQDGEALSGFAESNGSVFPIEGWIDGEEINFSVTPPDHDAPLMFVGIVDGVSASGTMDPTGGMHPEASMDWHAEKRESSLGGRS